MNKKEKTTKKTTCDCGHAAHSKGMCHACYHFFYRNSRPRNEQELQLRIEGKRLPRNKNGLFVCASTGCVFVRMPDHHRANASGFVRQHVLVMEEHLGRDLTDEEVIAHKDRNKQNNQIDNLILFENQSEHQKYAKKNRPKDLAPKQLPMCDCGRLSSIRGMCNRCYGYFLLNKKKREPVAFDLRKLGNNRKKAD